MKKNVQILLKWAFAVAAYGFLAYKLLTFEHYGELFKRLQSFEIQRFTWLLAVLLLLIPNLALEARKWQFLTCKIEKIPLKIALQAVVAGISTGFFTPNRIGEMAGRVLYLMPENRRKGVILSIISGITMSLTILILGVPALTAFLFFTGKTFIDNKLVYFSVVIFFTIFLLIFYFALPKIGKLFTEHSKFSKIKTFFSHLQNFTVADLLSIFYIAMARYFVFCLQFYCMLRFFDIDISLIRSLSGICTNYLFITFTPSFSFSEAAVRGSYAVIVFGAFGADEVSCVLTGICIWLINTI
ncbi:MAG: flippase-like domain-containing protein, partial [Prevotellaceae bacterium]|nr:flippase-like domain-containing protein [Prevotellaceae bacterium]